MYERFFLSALLATVCIEVIVVCAAARLRRDPFPLLRLSIAAVLASSFTLPYVWFVVPPFVPGQSVVLYSELLAFAAEALFFRYVLPAGWVPSLIYSFLANLCSYIFGLLFPGIIF